MLARWALALVSAYGLFGQAGTTPKDKPTDYPAQATLGPLAIGAEYLVHSIPTGNQTFVAPDYLVVEVAVFPGRDQSVEIGSRTFALRLNGKKEVTYPDAPGFAAASVKYPDWVQRKNLEVQASAGDAGVIVGRPPVVGRFPDDQRPSQSRLPRAPKAPEPDDRRGIEQEEPVRAEDAITTRALPEGAAEKPASGFLYFHYKGKTRSIKSIELVYEGKAGTVTLKLL
jgi:hypothetical protein